MNDSGLASFLFLDPRLFHKMRLQVPKIHTTVRASVVELVGDLDDIKGISTLYFDTIHAWMPIVSKKQFFENLPNRLTQRRSELFLLVLAMKLCCARITTPRTDLYHAVKQFYFDMENSGALSIQVLQAAILIAIYEVGHAIYPAAILSVGSCARYASCLGIDTTARPPKSMQLPWIEVEECCRIWWSIAILDRFVPEKYPTNYACNCSHCHTDTLSRFLNLCDPRRHPATPDPHAGTYLPVDDASWDAGVSCSHSELCLDLKDNLVEASCNCLFEQCN